MPQINCECPECEEYIDIDVDVEDFIEACDQYDIKDVIESLIDNHEIDPITVPDRINGVESVYEEALQKLHGKWNRLTQAEEEAIMRIANRF